MDVSPDSIGAMPMFARRLFNMPTQAWAWHPAGNRGPPCPAPVKPKRLLLGKNVSRKGAKAKAQRKKGKEGTPISTDLR